MEIIKKILSWINPEKVQRNLENNIDIFNSTYYLKTMKYIPYMEMCLKYYFEHLDELKGKYFNFFCDYLKRIKIHDVVTDKQIIRYLNGNISFDEIKSYYDEKKELQNNFNGDIFDYIIGYDSSHFPIFDEMQINKLKNEIYDS